MCDKNVLELEHKINTEEWKNRRKKKNVRKNAFETSQTAEKAQQTGGKCMQFDRFVANRVTKFDELFDQIWFEMLIEFEYVAHCAFRVVGIFICLRSLIYLLWVFFFFHLPADHVECDVIRVYAPKTRFQTHFILNNRFLLLTFIVSATKRKRNQLIC